MPDETPPICSNCETPMNLMIKGSDRFWGCPNWKDCGAKTIPYGGYKNGGYKKKPVRQSPGFKQEDEALQDYWLRKIYQKLDEILKELQKDPLYNPPDTGSKQND